ncbi:MAG: hypothetical protein E6I81_01845 [Chloroflexi bacterium]|nr:MAG: hypothetical protein E6I89_03580 [Chloroflexota bacterium]TMD74226.1 MAG: hypothetical protein E6I81_01845 [Chloroflexota bacterium]
MESSGSTLRDRAATRALVLGLLALPFGLLAPFAIFSGARSLRRIRASDGALRGATSAIAGMVAGLVGLITLVAGAAYWLIAS